MWCGTPRKTEGIWEGGRRRSRDCEDAVAFLVFAACVLKIDTPERAKEICDRTVGPRTGVGFVSNRQGFGRLEVGQAVPDTRPEVKNRQA
jgi:hypothetical protein